MDDHSNSIGKPQATLRQFKTTPDNYISPNSRTHNMESNVVYQTVKFKDIFDTDTSTSDVETSKSNNVSFSDLVVQERAKLKPLVSRIKPRNINIISNNDNKTISKISSPKRILRRSPSTIDALCADSVSVMNEADDLSKAITTPTHYIRGSKKINSYPTYTRRLSDNGTVWVSDNCNNFVAFNKNHVYNKFKLNRRKSRHSITRASSLIIDKKSWGFQNNTKLNAPSDKNANTCKSCALYCGKIRTLEADLSIEKQHFEEMCKANSELQHKLNESIDSVNQLNKQHSHKLNIVESKVAQLTDRNSELLKRIEMNIKDIDYFKNCLLDSHSNLETLQTKLNGVKNENSDLLTSIDAIKLENEKLVKECNYYKKQCKLLNDKLVQKSTIQLPQPQMLWPTVTHVESLQHVDINQSATADTYTEVDVDIKLPIVNVTGYDKGIFPSYVPSNSILTDTDETYSYKENDKINDLDDVKCIVNRTLDKPLELTVNSPVNSSPKNNDIQYNPTTKWILDRVSRPSNLESLFKLQDRIRDMSLRN